MRVPPIGVSTAQSRNSNDLTSIASQSQNLNEATRASIGSINSRNENRRDNTTMQLNQTVLDNDTRSIPIHRNNDPTTELNREEPRVLLEYPRNFFNPTNGAGPTTEEQACRLWMYRKARRTDGLADTDTLPDGKLMLQEIQEIRDSLRAHIKKTYEDSIRTRAKEMDVRMPGKASFPHTIQDFRKILNELTSTPDNERMVFELVHQFHKDRHWLAAAIDQWFDNEGMVLLPQQKPKFVNGKRTRTCPTDRGGFSAVARSAKSAVVGSLMSPMLCNAGWSISLTKGQGKNHSYEKKVRYNQSTFFYVVVSTEQVRVQAVLRLVLSNKDAPIVLT